MKFSVKFKPIIVIILILSNAVLSSQSSCDSCVDFTRVPGSIDTATVLASVRLVQYPAIFSEDHGILRRIAYAETVDGTENYEPYSGGIWKVSETVFNVTKMNITSTLLNEIVSTFDIDWSAVIYEDLDKPLYSALAARIYIQQLQDSGSDINNVEDQVALWVSEYSVMGNETSFYDAIDNAPIDDTEYTEVQFGTTLTSSLAGSISLRLKMSITGDSPLQFEISSLDMKQVTFYISNIPGTSEAVYCNSLTTNTTGQLHVNPIYMLPYGSSEEVFITISLKDNNEMGSIALHSSVLTISGYQNVGSQSNRFVIGMFSNHPDSGSLPTTLLISTFESTIVEFSIRSFNGVIMTGNVSSDETTKVYIPYSYVVSDLNGTKLGLVVETVDQTQDISVTVSSHYIYSSDSYLALPQIDYVDIDLYTYYAITPDTNITDLYHRVLLVGGHNSTTITVNMTNDAYISTNVISDGILLEGEEYTFIINELDTIMIESEYALTGSVFTACKPITFISGHQCAVIPDTGTSCDFTIEQYPPTITWGKTFLFPMLSSRTGGSYISIVSSQDYTITDIWCYSNSTEANITDVVYFDYSGEYINILVAPDDVYCSIVSDNSIMVTLVGTSENIDDSSGDPFMMIVPPVEQFYNDVSIIPNSDFEYSFINIMATVDSVQFDGSIVDDWIPVNTSYSFMLGYAAQIQISNDELDSIIKLSNTKSFSFAANVYGFNFSVGYGQITGMNFLITEGEYGGEELQVTITSDTLEAQSGQYLDLHCMSNGPPSYAIRWKRNETFISPSCKYSLSSSSRETSVLTVHDITLDDIGVYECVAYSYYTTAQPSTEVTVNVKADITATVSPIGVSILSYGGNVTLSCDITTEYDSNDLQYEWTFNNEPIRNFTYSTFEADSMLIIDYTDSSSPLMGGQYQCIGTNVAENVVGISNVVLIAFAPLIIQHPVNVFTSENETEYFYCNAVGFPTPEITWRRVNTSKVIIDMFMLDVYSTTLPENSIVDYINATEIASIFTINQINHDDYGYYVCLATLNDSSISAIGNFSLDNDDPSKTDNNTNYEISNTATLFVSPIGSVDINPSVASILVGEDVTFECSSDGGPDNQYQWTNLQSGDIISNIPYLVIESVSVSDGGQYECNVSNEAGYETAVSTINTPVLILNEPKDQLVEVGDNVTFMCTFETLNDVIVTWYFNDEIITDYNDIVTSENNSILYLYEVDESHSGSYICKIDDNIFDPINATGELTVGRLTVNVSPPGITSLTFGEEVQLSCTSTSNIQLDESLPTEFTWTLNNDVLNETSSILTVQYDNVESVNKGGYYQCFASYNDTLLTGSSNLILLIFAPYITTHPVSVSVNVNETIELSCTATGYPAPIIEWYRVESNTVFSDYDAVLYYSIELPDVSDYNDTTSDATITNATLIISPIDYIDYGYYLCVATLLNDSIVFVKSCCSGNATEVFSLDENLYHISNTSTVSVSPFGSVTADPSEITIPFNGKAVFNCSALGGPDNQFTWTYLNTGDIVSNESDLIIEMATLNNAGEYECTVSNSAGNESVTTNLCVTITMSLSIIEEPNNITVDVSDDAMFECVFVSQIPVLVEWFFDGYLIPFPHVIETTDNVSTLSLMNVNLSNAGNYSCQLDNGVEARINASAYLTVGQLTVTLLPTDVSVLKFGDELDIFCNISSNLDFDDFNYIWTFNDNVINETSSVITIKYDSAESVEQGGVYQCYGSDTSLIISGTSNRILVAFAPFILVQPMGLLTAAGDTAEFTCTATGHPVPEIEWHKVTRDTNITSFDDVLLYSEGIVFNETDYLDNVTSTSTFIIDSIENSDFGYYVCVASQTENSLIFAQDCCSDNVTEVQSVPAQYNVSTIATLSGQLTVTLLPTNVSVLKFGDELDIFCNISSNLDFDDFNYIWTLNDKVINETSSVITIKYDSAESVEQGGVYQCYGSDTSLIFSGTSNRILVAFAPIILVQPMGLLTAAGDTAEFTCTATGHPVPEIEWHKVTRDTNITSFDDVLLYSEGIVFNETDYLDNVTSTSTFIIDSIESSDFGYYVCVASQTENSLIFAQDCCSDNVTEVQSVPAQYNVSTIATLSGQLTVTLLPTDVSVLKFGDELDIFCNISRSNVDLDDFNYIWTFNDNVINETSSVITIKYDSAESVEQGGVYQCYGSDTSLIFSGTSNRILVAFASFILVQPMGLLTTAGDTAEFTCTATGHPVPEIEWHKVTRDTNITSFDDVLLYSEGIVFNETDYLDNVTSTSTFIIDSIENSDFGYYVCVASQTENSLIFAQDCCSDNVTEVQSVPAQYNVSTIATLSGQLTVTLLPTDVSVLKFGDELDIFCNISRSNVDLDDFNYIWTFNDNVINETSSVITIKYDSAESVEQGGVYQCYGSDTSLIFSGTSNRILVAFAPFILVQPMGLLTAPGDTAEFTCTATGHPVPEIEWHKVTRDTNITSFDDVLLYSEGIVFNETDYLDNVTSTSTFIIDSIENSDFGYYVCVASQTENSLIFAQDCCSDNVTEVQSVPAQYNVSTIATLSGQLTVTLLPTNVSVLKFGDELDIFCNISSNLDFDDFNYIWTLNDKVINETSSVITIKYDSAESVEQGGVYQCYGSDTSLIFSGTSNRILVAFAPIILVQPMGLLTAAGDTAEFTCTATGHPVPEIEWHKVTRDTNITSFDDVLLYSEGIVFNETDYLDNVTSTSTFIIDSIESSDFGYYVCVASQTENSLIFAQDCCSDNVTEVQSVPAQYNVSTIATLSGQLTVTLLPTDVSVLKFGDELDIFCNISRSNVDLDDFNYIWTFNDNVINETSSVITIKYDSAESVEQGGVYQCYGSDTSLIFSGTSNRILVAFASFILVQPMGLLTTAGDTAEFTCTATGHPVPEIEWHKVTRDTNITSFDDVLLYSEGIVFNETDYLDNVTSTSTFIIDSIENSDFGYYVCVASQTENSLIFAQDCCSDNVTEVQSVPAQYNVSTIATLSGQLTVTLLPTDVSVLKFGDELDIFCNISRSNVDLDDFNYIWTFNDNVINETSSVITIKYDSAESVEQGGVYQCYGSDTSLIFSGTSNRILVAFAPFILVQPMGLLTAPGDTAEFTCTATGHPVPEIEWHKVTRDTNITSFDDVLLYSEGIVFNETDYLDNVTSTSTFIIDSIESSDFGYYVCVASQTENSLIFAQDCCSDNVTEVQSVPAQYNVSTIATLSGQLTVTLLPTDVSVLKFGDELDIFCNISRSNVDLDDFNYIWTFNDNVINETSSVITIKYDSAESVEQGGVYQCYGSDTSLIFSGTSNRILVAFAPFILVQPMGLLTAPGDTAEFTCTATGHPVPEIEWHKVTRDTNITSFDDVLLYSEGIVFNETDYLDNVTSTSTFIIDSIENSDFGYYVCVASQTENSLIFAQDCCSDNVTEVQSVPAQYNVSTIATLSGQQLTVTLSPTDISVINYGEELNLSCNISSIMDLDGFEYSWMLNNEVLDETSSILTVQYDNVESVNEGGYYQCFASYNNALLTGSSNLILLIFAPYITTHPVSVSVNVNETIELSCTATGYPAPIIEWYRVESNTVFSDYDAVLYYSIELPDVSDYNDTTSDATITNATLIISPIDYIDYGYYLCVATLFNDSVNFASSCCNENSMERFSIGENLYHISNISTVSVSPFGSVTADPSEITIPFNGKAVFNCSALGGPDNQFTWTYLNTGDIVSNESDLIIEMATLNNAGEYECTVSNSAGSESVTTDLNVTLAALTILRGPDNVTVNIDDDLILSCEFFSQLPASVEWLFDSLPISFSHQIETSETMSNLSFNIVNVSYAGIYSCRVDNEIETAVNASAYVTVGQLTVTLLPTDVSVLKFGEELDIFCNISSNLDLDEFQYSWTFDDEVINETSSVITIKYNSAESVEQGGVYQCYGSDTSLIFSGTSNRILVAFAPFILVQPMGLLTAAGDTAEFTCTATGHPVPEIEWHKVIRDTNITSFDDVLLYSEGIVFNETDYLDNVTSTSTFIIDSIENSDFGYYVCVASQTENSLIFAQDCCSDNVTEVQSVPAQYNVSTIATLSGQQLTVTLSPTDISVINYGEELNLSCNISSIMDLDGFEYSWMLNNEVLDETSSILTVQYDNVESVNEGGYYQCFASYNNALLTGSSNLILLIFAPYITTHPVSVSVNVNETIELSCTATGYPAPIIEWYRVESNTVFSDYDAVLYYSIELPDVSDYNDTTSDATITNATLIISPIDYIDYGYYLCVATLFNDSVNFASSCCNENSMERFSIGENLYHISNISTVSVSPFGSVTADPSEITIPFNGKAVFNCSALGGPDNQFTWTYLNTGDIVSNESDLIIEMATLNNAGEYECTVSNSAGSESVTTDLNVTLAALTILRGPDNVTVNIDDDLILSCEFFSQLPASVEWLFDSLPISFSHQIETSETMSNLSFNIVNVSYAGIYSCRVDNEIETAVNASAYVTVGQLTVTLLPTDVSVLKFGEELDIFCNISSNLDLDEFQYSWTFDDEVINETSSVITIKYNSAESVEQGGVYQCYGSDTSLIFSGTSNRILVAFAPFILVQPMGLLTAAGDTAEFTCTATGHPVPEIEWHKVTRDTNITSFDDVLLYSEGIVFNETDYLDNVTSTSTFIIDSIESSDFGYYMCVASLNNESLMFAQNCCSSYQNISTMFSETEYTISTIATLTVSPIDSVEINPLEVNSSFDAIVIFNCTSEGGPNNQYQWTHVDTGSVIHDGPSLVIGPTSFENGGIYQCNVTNEAGFGEAISFLNNPVLLVNGVTNVTASVGDNVTLTCKFLSLIAVNAVWLHNDSILDDAVVVTTSNDTTLYLSSVTESQSGTYTCILDNGIIEAAESSGSVTIDQLTTTISPVGIHTLMFEEIVNISCSASIGIDINDLYYTWTFNDVPLNVTTSWLVVEYNSANAVEQGGNYQCLVTTKDLIFTGSSQYLLLLFAPYFIEHPQTVLTIDNSTAEFSCSAVGHPAPIIVWYRIESNDNITNLDAIMEASLLLPFPSFIETNINDAMNTGILYIDPVTYNDFGYYLCVATLDNETVLYVRDCCGTDEPNQPINTVSYSTLSNLTTLAISPEDSVIVEPFDIDVSVSEDALFNCTSMGGPDNIYEWTHIRTGQVVGNDPELLITTTEASDGGSYECTVTNIAGSDSSSSTLYVNPYFVQYPLDVYVLEGYTAVLNCTGIGYQVPLVTWRYNNLIVTNNSATFIQHINSPVNELLSILTLEAVEFNSSGAYECIAFNDVGSNISSPGFLTVVVPPVLVESVLNLTMTITDNATLICVFEGFPKPLINWYHNGVMISNDSELINETESVNIEGLVTASSYLRLSQISLENEGEYVCVATENIFGNSDFSTGRLTVQVPPTVTAIQSTISEAITHPVTLQFNISQDLPPVLPTDIQWIFNETDITKINDTARYSFSEDMLSLTINMLALSDEGVYTMIAFNPAGSDSDQILLNVEVPPLVIEGPMNRQILEGDSVTFKCIAMAEPDHSIQWEFNGQIISANSSKYILSGVNAMDISMLTIINVVTEDVGEYTCNAINEHGTANASATLEVQVPPLVELDEQGTLLNVTAGVELFLNCTSFGYPIPVIAWFRNNQSLVNNSSVSFNSYTVPEASTINELVLHNPLITDTAVYYCRATNNLVQLLFAESERLQIQVYSPPDIVAGINNVTHNTSDTLVLFCTFTGYPRPTTIQWFYRADTISTSIMLADSDRIRITDYDTTETGSGSGDNVFVLDLKNEISDYNQDSLQLELLNATSYLTVYNLLQSDEGYYSCSADNGVDNFINSTKTSEAFVTVQRAPVVYTDLVSPVIGLYTQLITLNVSIRDDSPTVLPEDIIWTFDGVEIKESNSVLFSQDRFSLTVTNLSISDEGVYSVAVSNPAGYDSTSIVLDVQVSPIVIGGPNDTAAIEGTNAVFTCEVFSEPTHELEWIFEEMILANDSQHTISSIDQSITVINVNLSLAGNYTCVARNIHGVANNTAVLEVQVSPSIVLDPPVTVQRIAGQSVSLSCIASGNPPPVIFWTHNSKQLQYKLIESINTNSDLLSTTNSTLVLEYLNLTNVGTYQCNATTSLVNDLSILSSTTSLTLQYPANVSVSPSVLVRGFNEQGSLVCTGFGIPPPTLSWSRRSGSISDSEFSTLPTNNGFNESTLTLTLLNTRRTLEGMYVCNGVNNINNLIGALDENEGIFFIEAEPSVVAVESEVTGFVGKDVVIEFEVIHAAPLVVPEGITWMFQSPGQSQRTLTEPADARLSFSQDRLSLTISDLVFSYEGIYTFTAINDIGEDSVSLTLTVDEFPIVTSISPSMNVTSPEDVTITCTARAKPDPGIVWLFNGSPVTDDVSFNTNSYTVNVDSISKAGQYLCLAMNEHARENKTLQIDVQDPPQFTEHPVANINGTVASILQLQCVVYGFPRPTLIWLKDGTLVEENIGSGVKYIIVYSDVSDNELMASIMIEDLNYDDNGMYTCMAKNSLFEQKATNSSVSVVDIHYPPDLQSGLANVTKNATDTLELFCNYTGTPTPIINWIKSPNTLLRQSQRINIEYEKSENGRIAVSYLTINDLVKDDEGTYMCVGINGVENLINAVDTSQAFVTVQVPPTIIPTNNEYSVTSVKDFEFTISFVISDDFPRVTTDNIVWQFSSNATGQTTTIISTSLIYISEDRLSLNFMDVELMDRGNYTLMATNEAGTRMATINMDVHVEPRLLNSTGGVLLVNGTGGNITFNCTVDGLPRPDILWRRNGILILNTTRTVIGYTEDPDDERVIRVNEIDEIEQASSTIQIFNLRNTDTGLYTCRGDNSAGRAAILQAPFNLTVLQFIPPPKACTESPNRCGDNGECIDTAFGNFICSCSKGYTGTVCDQEVVILIAPFLQRLLVSIGVQPSVSLPLDVPTNATGELFGEMNISCLAAGNPVPIIVWNKTNSNFISTGVLLSFPELNLTQRGFYRCSATNQEGAVTSELMQVNISNVLQYEVVLDVSNMSLTNIEQLDALVENISSLFSGGRLTGTDGIFYSIVKDPRQEDSLQSESVIVTLISDEGGNPQVLETLISYMSSVLQQDIPTISLLSATLDRFDGCSSENTLIRSQSNSLLDFNITWPETNLGNVAIVECPCGGLNLSSTALIARRKCGGNYDVGAVWEAGIITPCNFSDEIRELCSLASRPPVERIEALTNITQNVSTFDTTEVTVSVALLATTTANISGNVTLTMDYFDVVDNLLSTDEGVLQESQNTANTSAILLESIQTLGDEIVVKDGERAVFTQDTFAVSVQPVDPRNFVTQQFTFNVGDDIDNAVVTNMTVSVDTGERRNTRPAVTMTIPENIFDNITTNNTRITNAVFITDSLFLRREKFFLEVGSIIVALSIPGETITGLDPSLITKFTQKRSLENATDPSCVFWDQSLDDGFGSWSTEGCIVTNVYTNVANDTVIECSCTHLTSFSILLDVSPNVNASIPDRPIDTALTVVTYMGCIVSIICLLITIISYLANRKLRSSEHGLLLMNLCFALIGLYGTFILAIHSTDNVGFCAFVGALLQYFFLATFLVMAAEAINLYLKLVVILGSNISHFVWKVMIICWGLPAVIVLFTFAPDYKNYHSDNFCRAFGVPFYVGVIVPFILIYIFNWSVFVIIFVNLIYKAKTSKVSDMKNQKKTNEIKQQFVIAITLSILFGLGWGIGLPATDQLQNTIAVRDTFASLFVLLTSFQGFFVFFMHCLRSPDIRKQWKIWFKITTRQDYTEHSTSATSRINKKNRNLSDATASTSAGEKASAKYKFIKKNRSEKNIGSSSVGGDEFSFISDNDDGLSTLRRNVDKSGITDNNTTLQRFGKGADAPNINYLPQIEENEKENLEQDVDGEQLYVDEEGSSDNDFWNEQQAATTFALPEGVIGDQDFNFDFDERSLDCLSTTSNTRRNTIFHNPMQMLELNDPFKDDRVSYGDALSVTSEYDTSQTVFINPMEDTV